MKLKDIPNQILFFIVMLALIPIIERRIQKQLNPYVLAEFNKGKRFVFAMSITFALIITIVLYMNR